MRTIFAEYNSHRNSIDVYTNAVYILRIDCWEAEKDLKTTPGSDCALNALAIDEPLEYVRLYQEGDSTIPARLQLLLEQRQSLLEQKKKIDETLDRLNYKISIYEDAVKTGKLSW